LSLQAYTLITLQTHGSGCKATYPEMVTKPGHKPELKPTSNACVVDNQWPSNCHESKHSSQADLHTRYLTWAIFFQVKVPHKPVPNGSPWPEWTHAVLHQDLHRLWQVVPLFTYYWVPGSVFFKPEQNQSVTLRYLTLTPRQYYWDRKANKAKLPVDISL
jgi:hypothetical protein